MKTWIKILIALVVLGAIGAWAGYTFIYNKAHTDYEKADPDFVLSAAELYSAFTSDAKAAAKNYNGKVIQIAGLMNTVEEADSLVIGVFAFEQGMFGAEGVRVTMLPNYHEKILEHPLSEEITLKGFCSGYNDTDVIMENGSVVK